MTNADQYTFDLEPGRAERDRAIEQVTAHAKVGFIEAGREALERCCFTMETFTTDEIWALIPEGINPHEPRAMASIMKYAYDNNWAYPLFEYRPSSRPKAHRGPKRVWRSRVYAIRDALQPSYEEEEREPVAKACMHTIVYNEHGEMKCYDCGASLGFPEQEREG